ncbi:MAG: DUF354 domain-containing protein [Lachnospiraceae bacterium]|nr:DUF354 domain-containing protein [Lachnospiraceae bacterium]
MKAAISIEHPAWAHQFKNIIKKINAEGETLVLSVDKDGDIELLDSFNIRHKKLADSTGRNIIEKGLLFVKLCIDYTREIKEFDPDILIGRASPMMAVAALLTGKPHVIFEDTEVSRFSLGICKRFSICIITPQTFLSDLGRKQLRMPVYKELFYLNRQFQPDLNVLKESGINLEQRYAVVRFVAWNASHDVGKTGLNEEAKIDFITQLQEQIQVYISSEDELPEELKKYQLKVPFDKIHHVLYYAALVISEGASMASEAAVLGTHAFYLNEIASGTTEEQEKRFHILKVLHDPVTRYRQTLIETKNMLKNENLWKEGKEIREQMLREMPDPNMIFWEKMMEVCSRNEVEK